MLYCLRNNLLNAILQTHKIVACKKIAEFVRINFTFAKMSTSNGKIHDFTLSKAILTECVFIYFGFITDLIYKN